LALGVVSPAEANTAHVPPPVAALDVPSPPAGATNVPEPVIVICDPSFANAEAMPPGCAKGPGTMVIMSHLTWAAVVSARALLEKSGAGNARS